MGKLFASTVIVVIIPVLFIIECHASVTPVHECFRPCAWPAEPLVCNYHFKVEWFSSMAHFCGDCPQNSTHCDNVNCIPLNGVQRPILTVNRQLPGPSIRVCEGDTINVNVQNMVDSHEEVTIHWHGMHQRGSPFMDGVPKVTQCPIPFGSSFVYTFNAAEAGTHYWHAHSGHQRADGCAGPLVVRQAPQRDVHFDSYQIDDGTHTLLLQDWFDDPTLVTFIGHHLAMNFPTTPDSILINGHGERVSFETNTNNVDPPVYTAREILHVQPQMKIRFRVISNGITNCPLQISVDNHTLTVIATDGRPVKAKIVDSFVIFIGERFDFLLDADQDVGNYWFRVKGLGDCNSLQELAVVRYHGANTTQSPELPEDLQFAGTVLNPYDEVDTTSGMNLPLHLLESLEEDNEGVLGNTVTRYYLPMDVNSVSKYIDSTMSHDMSMTSNDGGHTITKRASHENMTMGGHAHGSTTSQINHASFRTPAANLLTQIDDIDPSTFCDVKDIDHMCKMSYCECTQVLYAKLGEVIELVLVDEGFGTDQTHPMHIHGHVFRVVAQEKKGDSLSVEHVMEMDANGTIVRNLDSPPFKDTVAVPNGGYTIIRFNASNPGWWLFHCHIEFHLTNGMVIVIHVGDKEDQPPTPYNFPTCNSWQFQVEPEIEKDSAATRPFNDPMIKYWYLVIMWIYTFCIHS